jgi:hypothetical protein
MADCEVQGFAAEEIRDLRARLEKAEETLRQVEKSAIKELWDDDPNIPYVAGGTGLGLVIQHFKKQRDLAREKGAEMRKRIVKPSRDGKGFFCTVCGGHEMKNREGFGFPTTDGTEKHGSDCPMKDNLSQPLLDEMETARRVVEAAKEVKRQIPSIGYGLPEALSDYRELEGKAVAPPPKEPHG